ncbi:MAG: CarD family transcriptional regulator [Desulfovibrionaceae bacterium]|nr:CarD family transcriptional regulator [Desulfovibrionaceae bacterium]
MFSPGQTVVYPAQGVGIIKSIETQELAGVSAEFYTVHILSTGINVLVPVKSAVNAGLRNLCSQEEARKTLDNLKDYQSAQVHAGQNWNRRQREYTERLKEGKLETVGGVLKELILISSRKELSFGEKRLLEQAMSLVAGELACVLNKDEEEIKETINSFYSDLFPSPAEE